MVPVGFVFLQLIRVVTNPIGKLNLIPSGPYENVILKLCLDKAANSPLLEQG
jgi:hypothetical protein